MPIRPPLPPFTRETALQKVRSSENAWNTRDPRSLSLAFSEKSLWTNRTGSYWGREAIEEHLGWKWANELDYRVIMELWGFMDDRISVRFAYECHDRAGVWIRAQGNSNWTVDPKGLLSERFSCVGAERISDEQRLFRWPLGIRPEGYPGLKELGL